MRNLKPNSFNSPPTLGNKTKKSFFSIQIFRQKNIYKWGERAITEEGEKKSVSNVTPGQSGQRKISGGRCRGKVEVIHHKSKREREKNFLGSLFKTLFKIKREVNKKEPAITSFCLRCEERNAWGHWRYYITTGERENHMTLQQPPLIHALSRKESFKMVFCFKECKTRWVEMKIEDVTSRNHGHAGGGGALLLCFIGKWGFVWFGGRMSRRLYVRDGRRRLQRQIEKWRPKMGPAHINNDKKEWQRE